VAARADWNTAHRCPVLIIAAHPPTPPPLPLQAAHLEMINFMKNLSIIGGLVMFLTGGSSPKSKSKYD
jgi:hypothetical protein